MKRETFQEKILDRWSLNIEPKDSYKIHEEKYWFTCKNCGHKWKQMIRFDRNLSCPNCHPFEHGSSRGELELYDLLLTTGYNVVNKNRTILDGKEIDIYFPDYKFGIEYDGAHWHTDEEDRTKDQLCKEKGIFLIRVDDIDFCCDRADVLNRIKSIFENTYHQPLEVRPEKVKEVIRTSERCRKIICTDTMEIFDSYMHAGSELDIPAPEIHSVCNGNIKNYYGYHFQYYEDGKVYEKTERGYEYKCKRVKCIETGEVFESIVKASGLLRSIADSIYERQKQAGGLHWELTDEQVTDTSKTEKLITEYMSNFTRKKSVVCLTDGKTFDSAREAAEFYGIGEVGISDCCRGTAATTHGRTFQYVGEPHPFIPKEIPTKKVYCIDLNLTFDSLEEARNYFGAPHKDHISRVCRGERKFYKGHILKYVDGCDVTYTPVIIMETEQIFSSIDECADFLGIDKVIVRYACEWRKHSAEGCHICYKIDYDRNNNPWFGKPIAKRVLSIDRLSSSSRGNQVIIMETEEAFNTVSDCAAYLEVSKGVLSENLNGKSKTCKGYHVCYKEKYDKNNNPWLGKERYSDKESHGQPKRVMCIETGEIFGSAKEASSKMKVNYSAVCAVCNGKRKTTGGYSFKFI